MKSKPRTQKSARSKNTVSESKGHGTRDKYTGSEARNVTAAHLQPRTPAWEVFVSKVLTKPGVQPRALPSGQLLSPIGVLQAKPSIQIVGQGPDSWPAPWIENRHAWVSFGLRTWAVDIPSGPSYVLLTVKAKQSLDTYDGDFLFTLGTLDRFSYIEGAISFDLPRAALGNTLTLTWFALGPIVNEFQQPVVIDTATMTFDVGGKFYIAMQNIFIANTASHHEDTLYVALSSAAADGSVSSHSAYLGSHDNTGRQGIPSQVLPAGPFIMMPSGGNFVAVTAVIANKGHSSREDDAKRVLDDISEIGAVIATTICSTAFPAGAPVWAALSAAINALNQDIFGWIFADCDTVVLANGIFASPDDLFTISLDPNDQQTFFASPNLWPLVEAKRKGENISAGILPNGQTWLGGGCEDSNYSTNLSLIRVRQEGGAFVESTNGLALAPLQQAQFTQIGSVNEKIAYSTMRADSTVTELGIYEAPAQITFQKYDIVSWVATQINDQGLQEDFSGFCIVVLQ